MSWSRTVRSQTPQENFVYFFFKASISADTSNMDEENLRNISSNRLNLDEQKLHWDFLTWLDIKFDPSWMSRCPSCRRTNELHRWRACDHWAYLMFWGEVHTKMKERIYYSLSYQLKLMRLICGTDFICPQTNKEAAWSNFKVSSGVFDTFHQKFWSYQCFDLGGSEHLPASFTLSGFIWPFTSDSTLSSVRINVSFNASVANFSIHVLVDEKIDTLMDLIFES